jgi:hypothetical protein
LMPIIGDEVKDDNQSDIFRLTVILQTHLMTSSSVHMTSGIIEALLRLTEVHQLKNGLELLQQVSQHLTTRSQMTSDIGTHCKLLKMASNILPSLSVQIKKRLPKSDADCKDLAAITQELLQHCCRVLNIVNHLMDSNAPTIQAPKNQGAQVTQNSITNPNASPVKQLKAPAAFVQELADSVSKEAAAKKAASEAGSDQAKKWGYFSNSHHYMRLFDTVRNLHLAQRNNLDS